MAIGKGLAYLVTVQMILHGRLVGVAVEYHIPIGLDPCDPVYVAGEGFEIVQSDLVNGLCGEPVR